MSNQERTAGVLIVAVSLALATTSAGCRRACEAAENCVRTCDCTDNVSGAVLECPIAFKCELGEGGFCEADYDALSCDEICQEYAAVAKCGFERCSVNEDCREVVSCPVIDPATGQPTPLRFNCTRDFTCGQADQLCAAGSELSDEQLCAQAECRAQQP